MRVDRVEIEITLNRDRERMLTAFASLPRDVLMGPATRSEDDPELWWTPKDHFSHLLRVERYFTSIIAAFLGGATDDPVASVGGRRGETREEILVAVNRVNEEFMRRYRDTSFEALVRLTQAARAKTFALLARIDDDQFDVQMPRVPWSGGTIGGVLLHNGGNHFDRHWQWISAGLADAS